MRKLSLSIMSFVLLCAALAIASGAWADGLKERMEARLPEIVALKGQGVIGENNAGYLDYPGAARQASATVQAENDDRRTVYEAIARQQSTSVELVGRRRAQQIAARANPGDWLQDEAGRWYQKR